MYSYTSKSAAGLTKANASKFLTSLKSREAKHTNSGLSTGIKEFLQLYKGSKHDRKRLALEKQTGENLAYSAYRDRPGALSDSAADFALSNSGRNNHAARHLIDAGLLGAWSAATEEEFKDIVYPILTKPFNTFYYDLRGVKCSGFVNSDQIAVLVYDSGTDDGLVATTYVATDEQLKQWGMEQSF